MYPSKTTLEECCRTIVKYYSKGGGVSTFEDNEPIYRLVDPEGMDISLDELIKRYLGNPEIAFKQLPPTSE
jgi:hypothetical protein